MLTIGKLGSSRKQLQYYEQQVASGIEDYSAGRGRPRGSATVVLGVAPGRRVDREAFLALMSRCHAVDGSVLRPMGRCSTVAALDLTFSAPKSVSVLFGVTDDDVSAALLEPHEPRFVSGCRGFPGAKRAAGCSRSMTFRIGVLRYFSQRRAEIEERARELVGAGAELSREAMQGIALATRRAKEYGVNGATWREQAQARAAEHGFGQAELEALRRRQPRQDRRDLQPVFSRLSGPRGLTDTHNTFARRHALAEIAVAFGHGARPTSSW
jgi:hypothetical protein